MLVAGLVLLLAGAIGPGWLRALVIVDGSVLAWFGLAAMARAGREWPRALARGTALYAVPVLAFLLAGAPWQLALAWPYVPVQAWLACPLGLPCPLGA